MSGNCDTHTVLLSIPNWRPGRKTNGCIRMDLFRIVYKRLAGLRIKEEPSLWKRRNPALQKPVLFGGKSTALQHTPIEGPSIFYFPLFEINLA